MGCCLPLERAGRVDAMRLLARLGALALAAALGFAARGCLSRPVTLAGVSPDGKWRVALVERPSFVDRNFEVEVEDRRARKKRVVFHSPDEGRPGGERLVWSEDGSRVLLLGRKFFVREGSSLPDGELPYLMVDLAAGDVWCNASQQKRHAGFGVEDLRSRRWVGWAPPAAVKQP